MRKNSDYIIQYEGLNLGTHAYQYEIGKTFFDEYDYSDFEDCKISIQVSLEKSTSMMVLYFDVEGTINLNCDRCLEDLDLTITERYRQVIKFSDFEETDIDDEIVILPTGEYELDIAKFIFDFILLSVPNKRAHDEGECDETAMQKLNTYLLTDEPVDATENMEEQNKKEIDPRWKVLEQLKKK